MAVFPFLPRTNYPDFSLLLSSSLLYSSFFLPLLFFLFPFLSALRFFSYPEGHAVAAAPFCLDCLPGFPFYFFHPSVYFSVVAPCFSDHQYFFCLSPVFPLCLSAQGILSLLFLILSFCIWQPAECI